MMKQKVYFLVFVLPVILVLTDIAVSALKRPTTDAELALYTGADRQQILEEGAKKEGKLTFYTSGTIAVPPVVAAFEKKYPYIKVNAWRAGTESLLPRILEEYNASKHLADAIESSQETQLVLQKGRIVQPFYSPNLAYIEEGAITKAQGEGVVAVAFRVAGWGLGYNTKLITREEIPKTYQDLLNPKWKGKMPISGGNTGSVWVGTILETYGEEFVKRLAQQNFIIHVVSGRAIAEMVINGEYAFSPTVSETHVFDAKKTAAPIDWIPLEPVHVNLGQIAFPVHAPNPHAALLFLDFILSKEVAEIHKTFGYNHTRKDVESLSQSYKKFFGVKSLEQAEKWENLFNSLFLKK